jgi:AcrR family transcriptional regulator
MIYGLRTLAMPSRSHTPKGQLSRSRILRAAEPLFVARGFHGTSMRDVAEAAELPLASVVYHFARKEGLYAAVLEAIAADLLGVLHRTRGHDRDRDGEPLEAELAVRALVRWSLENQGRIRLIMRELLDNPARVSRARSLPFAPVLTQLAAAAARRGHPRPEIAVLHVIGAVSYVIAADPTLRRIVGKSRHRELMETYADEAVGLAQRAFDADADSASEKESPHAAESTDRARPPGPRPPRGEDDRLGSVRREGRRPGLLRRTPPRA